MNLEEIFNHGERNLLPQSRIGVSIKYLPEMNKINTQNHLSTPELHQMYLRVLQNHQKATTEVIL
jgi:hypothetical protein